MNLARYKDFDSFFEACLPAEQAVISRIRDLIQANFPELKEKFAYGVPYYWGRSRICFLYPASFPYSGLDAGVNLGFARGHLLSDAQGLLVMGDRKEVGYIKLGAGRDVREDVLLEILHEAVLVDEGLNRVDQP
jgi:hypothetical protein